MYTRILRIMALLVAFSIIATTVKAQSFKYGLVTEDALNVRFVPKVEGNQPIGKLLKGMMIRYVDVGGWGQIAQDFDLHQRISRHTNRSVPLTGKSQYVSLQYIDEVTPQELAHLPLQAGEERWIVVDLSDQKLYAYSRINGVQTLFLETGVSTGRPGFRTPTNQPGKPFTIQSKRLSQSMVGHNRTEGFWIVRHIPAVQYVVGSVALHGTYWHNAFGKQPDIPEGYGRSHGCINLPIDVALRLFAWTTPSYNPFVSEYFQVQGGTGTKVYIQP